MNKKSLKNVLNNDNDNLKQSNKLRLNFPISEIQHLKVFDGITLVALVITIVVLLILAGVSLNMLIGENGIITKTQISKEKSNKSSAQETLQIKITNIQMNEYAENQKMPSLEKLGIELGKDKEISYVASKSKKQATRTGCEVENWNNVNIIYTKLENYKYEFGINSSLQIASVDGNPISTNTANTVLSTEQYNSLKQELLSDLTKSIYPVGYIYMSTENTDPGTLFGGTWEKYGEGKTIVGEGTGTDTNSESKSFTAGTTGGEYNHKLTVSEMPSHNHGINLNSGIAWTSMIRVVSSSGLTTWNNHMSGFSSSSCVDKINTNDFPGANHIHNVNGNSASTGSGDNHNNIQPYIVTYMWKKVSD